MRACQAPAFSQAIVAELKLISLVWLGNKFWIVQTWLENVPLSKTQWCWLPVRGLNEILFVLWNLVQSVSGVCWWSIAWRDFMCFFFSFFLSFNALSMQKSPPPKVNYKSQGGWKWIDGGIHLLQLLSVCLISLLGATGRFRPVDPPKKTLRMHSELNACHGNMWNPF